MPETYNVKTAEALQIVAEFGIKSEKTLKRYRDKGLLSAETRPDESNNLRETVFYNREELEALVNKTSSSFTPVVVNNPLQTNLDSMNVVELLSALSNVLQQSNTINERVLNLSQAAKESGLKKHIIKQAIEAGQIVARKSKPVKRTLNGKEFVSVSYEISRVSLNQFTFNYLRAEEPKLLSKSANI
jgi:hypothetical protein